MATFEIGDWTVPPGTVGKGTVGEVRLAAGTTVRVPVVVVNGAEDGPVLVVTGATHGDEIVGTGSLVSAIRKLDPARMRGTLVAIMVANPLAFEAASYGSPYDRLHMAQPLLWPSSPDGLITQRLAAAFRPVLDQATHYLDLHGNPDPSFPMAMLFPDQARDDTVRAAQRSMADAAGLTAVRMFEPPDSSGSLVGSIAGQPAAAASAHGIAGVMVELSGRHSLAGTESGRIVIMNVMRRIGMLDGALEDQPVPRLPGRFTYHGALVNRHAGLFWPARPPGDLVREGEVLGEISDVWGDRVEEIVMPVTGFLWGYPGSLHGQATHALPEGVLIGFCAVLDNPDLP
ncbi:succinylglutamate desuccinylase/aspartoacylase family protein [Amycolatopsis jejuensis]|uniref:succinylglutamate desuccinylase/aspartoacylase family protein n=1 Tax=Amycolatopsis jejuensis TaxID=330084 RepID=UPI0006914AA6|nr:succinylglutamate desuccinylase/aspartoacylase family protein [Amycolatopsis jejuensis]